MKKSLSVAITFLFVFNLSGYAQMLARMEVKDKIIGICDEKNVYVFFPMQKGEIEAVPPISKKKIQEKLNSEVTFFKDSINYQDKGMVDVITNCKGEVVRCETDTKTKHPELDRQILLVFNNLGSWKPAKLNGEKVDMLNLLSFDIIDGKIILN
jgi:hypothetical protein